MSTEIHSTSVAILVGALVAVVPGLALGGDRAAETAGSATMRLADLDGRWRQLDSDVATQARFASIDSAVEPLTWVVQKMASGVLRSTTAPRPTLHIVWDGERLQERIPGKDKLETRWVDPGTTAVAAVDSRGEPFEGAWDWTTDGLRFRWRQHQAYGANLYRMDHGKRTLTIDHTIHVTALEGVRPIAYRSRFSKDALPAVSSAGDGAPR